MSQIIPQFTGKLDSCWQKELAEVVTDPKTLLKMLEIPVDDYLHHCSARKLFPVRVPKSFISLMEKGNINDPLLRQVMPLSDEFLETPGFSTDPLQEHQSAAPGLLHKYHSRVLLIVKAGCAINCRYCFRRHFPYQENSAQQQGWQPALDYIAQHKEINEVIFSGGDPLMANDQQLKKLISAISEMKHIKRLRIHTRLPVVIPSRLTDTLIELLSKTQLQACVVFHINHPNEISPALTAACQRLQQAGITLLNQGVLLTGVNDDAEVLSALSERLFASHILPYYLFLLDKVQGAAHFEVSESQAIAIYRQLLAKLPGYLVPKLTREQAGEANKTPINLA